VGSHHGWKTIEIEIEIEIEIDTASCPSSISSKLDRESAEGATLSLALQGVDTVALTASLPGPR
jgi:hypothetical protein